MFIYINVYYSFDNKYLENIFMNEIPHYIQLTLDKHDIKYEKVLLKVMKRNFKKVRDLFSYVNIYLNEYDYSVVKVNEIKFMLCANITLIIFIRQNKISTYKKYRHIINKIRYFINEYSLWSSLERIQLFVTNYIMDIPNINLIINKIKNVVCIEKESIINMNLSYEYEHSDINDSNQDKVEVKLLNKKKHTNIKKENKEDNNIIKYVKLDENVIVKAEDIIKPITQDELKLLTLSTTFSDNSDNMLKRNNNYTNGINARFSSMLYAPTYQNLYYPLTLEEKNCCSKNIRKDNLIIKSLKQNCKGNEFISNQSKDESFLKEEKNREFISNNFYPHSKLNTFMSTINEFNNNINKEEEVIYCDSILAYDSCLQDERKMKLHLDNKNNSINKRNLLYLYNQNNYK